MLAFPVRWLVIIGPNTHVRWPEVNLDQSSWSRFKLLKVLRLTSGKSYLVIVNLQQYTFLLSTRSEQMHVSIPLIISSFIWIIDVFFVMSFLCSLKFLLFHRIVYPKRWLWKKLKFFYGSVFVTWLYLQKAVYRPCDLDLWPMKVFFQWIEYNPRSILYKFQIDISSNCREIKYQNIDQTHRHTDTQTQTHTQTGRPGENNTSQPPPGAR